MWHKAGSVEELRDIKGLMSIEDYSLYAFIVLLAISIIVFYLIIKKIINIKTLVSPEKKARAILKNIDLNDSKLTSYKISKYGNFLTKDSFEYLEKYKYKREKIGFTDEDLKKIKEFLDAI